eukprot:206654_1
MSMMSQSSYDRNDIESEPTMDSVLDDIEQMMMSDTTVAPMQSTPMFAYYNPNNLSTPVYPHLVNYNSCSSTSTGCNTPVSTVSPISSVKSHSVKVNVSRYKPDNYAKSELKDHVFISKDCTYRLGQYVVKENWGKDGVLLYKYLDYIFRCQLFDEQIKRMQDTSTRGEFLVFHTGLQRRSDHQYLYVLLYPNFISKSHKNRQKWRVQFGNVGDSFVSKYELLNKLKDHGMDIELYLPQKTVFAKTTADAFYHPMYDIEVGWEERLITNQDRIHKVIGDRAFFDKSRKHLKLSQLMYAFDEALRQTRIICSLNPALAVPQGFVDTKRRKYRMELLLPLVIQFEGMVYSFALAVAPSCGPRPCYTVKSILTLNMGYNNARLVGYVHSLWLRA